MTLTDHESLLVSTIVEHMEARDVQNSTEWKTAQAAAERGKVVKEWLTLGGSLVAVIGVATAYIFEMDAKPNTEEVQQAIVDAVAPVSAETKALQAETGTMQQNISEIQKDMERVEKIQDFSLDQSVYQGDVLDHIAQRRKGPPPPKPARLREKERELIR
jgi:hypothetical protein